MNCAEFKEALNLNESLEPEKLLIEHAQGCSECGFLLQVEMNIFRGSKFLGDYSNSPDLSEKIMEKIRMEPVVSKISVFHWLLRILRPSTPFKATLFYSFAAIIIFALCQKIIFEAESIAKKNSEKQDSTWQFILTKGKMEKGSFLIGNPSPIFYDQEISLSDDSSGNILIPGRGEIMFSGAHFRPTRQGVEVRKGSAYLKLPYLPEHPFVVFSQFGSARVIGAEFLVTVTDNGMKVRVYSGKVEVLEKLETRILAPGEEIKIQDQN